MQNMCFCMTYEEKSKCACDWEFISKNRSRWEPFAFNEDSIELQIKADPRIVINDIEYQVYRYMVIQNNPENIRLIVLEPIKRPAK